MTAPLIGVTTYGRNDEKHFTLPSEYVDSVRRAGGVPLLLAPGETRIQRWLDTVDGVILAETARAGIPILDVAATQVKKSLTGNGHASKAQVQRAVAGAFGLSQVLEPDDVADAAAIALCGLHLKRTAPHRVDPRATGVAT